MKIEAANARYAFVTLLPSSSRDPISTTPSGSSLHADATFEQRFGTHPYRSAWVQPDRPA
ncbi:hypothetical protein ABZ927_18640 [Streptomyces massasporeus]